MNELEAPPVPLPEIEDYTLNRKNSDKAIQLGLAEADWYQCQVPRETMRKLLVRRDGPAIRDTMIWFGLIFLFGYLTFLLRDSAWVVVPYLIYAALYASTADSRWHEAGHGTAFRTDWMNNALYEVASFMVMREGVVWRWSHNRHHSDTIIVGRDPEIAVPRPPDIKGLLLSLFALKTYPDYFGRLFLHSFGKLREAEKTFIPESEYSKVFLTARIHLAVYLTVIALAIATGSFLPLFYVGLTHFFGTWLMLVYGLTQHTGLAENVLDHRLNCRTFHTHLVNRFLYWNMNYHVEHHMFPLVPYHAVPALHEAIKDDCPEVYLSLFSCWKEIIPTVLKQVKDPAFHVKRTLPDPKTAPTQSHENRSDATPDENGWIEVCAGADLGIEDVIRFDHGNRTFALYRDGEGEFHATDGVCTHGNTHLADGLVKGKLIECPKHNGRFHLKDGSPARTPICRGLATYPLEERSGRLCLNVQNRGGVGAREESALAFEVVANRPVATFITEVTLRPVDPAILTQFTPGDYLQIDIPAYGEIQFREFEIPEPFASVWERHQLF
ncbi:MAG: fatty acid desaturase, partial [Verrucomicrobiota bacterium]